MTDDDGIAVSVSRDFAVPAERVFDAWLDPAMVRHWLAPGLGEMVRVEIDPRVGGAFRLDQERDGEVARHWGTYREIERPRRLVFTWCVDGADGEDLVAIDITPMETGCRVTVTHRMEAAFADYVEPTRRGWGAMLDGLATGLAATGADASRAGEVPDRLTLVRRLGAPPERVFAAWTDPALAGQWLFTSPESERRRHQLDPRPGGEWTITDRREGRDYTATGRYLEVEHPRRLAFTFAMPQFSPNSDRITIGLAPEGDGCRMTVVQEGKDIAAELRGLPPGTEGGSETGWRRMFDRLGGVLTRDTGHGSPAGSGAIRFERLLPGPIERVWAFLTESDRRGLWLAVGDMEPRAGTSFALHFDHAGLSPRRAPTPERFRHFEGGCTTRHEVLHWEPPHLLALTWGGGAEAPSEVSFELSEEGDRVRLVLTHRRLGDSGTMANVAGGWHTHLAILGDVLADRTPPPFWVLFEGIEEEYARRLDASHGVAAGGPDACHGPGHDRRAET